MYCYLQYILLNSLYQLIKERGRWGEDGNNITITFLEQMFQVVTFCWLTLTYVGSIRLENKCYICHWRSTLLN